MKGADLWRGWSCVCRQGQGQDEPVLWGSWGRQGWSCVEGSISIRMCIKGCRCRQKTRGENMDSAYGFCSGVGRDGCRTTRSCWISVRRWETIGRRSACPYHTTPEHDPVLQKTLMIVLVQWASAWLRRKERWCRRFRPVLLHGLRLRQGEGGGLCDLSQFLLDLLLQTQLLLLVLLMLLQQQTELLLLVCRGAQ